MSKPNWVCAVCGMYSSRKGSVKRHIRNLHGSGNIVSFIDFLAGTKNGFYPFGAALSISRDPKEPDFAELGTRAFHEGFWTEAGREAFKKSKTQ